jgi:hypothetical protein
MSRGLELTSTGNRTFEAFGAVIPSYSDASAEVPSYQHGGSVLNPEHGCEVNGGPVGCDRLGIWLSGLGIPVVGGVIIQETSVSKANYLKLNNEDELANIFADRGASFEKHGNEMWFLMSYSDEINVSAVQISIGNRQTRHGPKIGKGVPANIRSLVSDLASREACAAILQKFKDVLDATEGKIKETDDGKSFVETVFDSLKGEIRIKPEAAGSGARTDGDNINLRSPINDNQTFINGYYAKYVLQELVHNFKRGGRYDDAAIDRAALTIFKRDDPEKAVSQAKRKQQERLTDGSIAHQLINQYCQYTQEEVDKNAK